MICDVCGKDGARIRHVARHYDKGEDLFVIENVPVVVCPNCGESYLTAETLHEVERLKLDRKTLAQERYRLRLVELCHDRCMLVDVDNEAGERQCGHLKPGDVDALTGIF